ncbi:MAG: ATP-binding cassette domain-containing protein [Candidatus Latescibacteria bacterium]|nr:ATP-binding cassette domain-containing protein [bacterium]MBD3423652.1 ATP-binding cassette domain-containing protein [Candidatus Latescibacterota bacterium]
MGREDQFINISGLSRNFGNTRALKGIDILIDEPGVYGFLGPNGAGKTTTFKIICALLRPTSGNVEVCGIDVFSHTVDAMSRIGVQFDSPAFYPYLTGRENLRLKKKWLRGYHTLGVEEMLELSGLGSAASRKVKEYSWGMKQRLSLASALISDPSVLLLDEPTNGLDPAGIAYVRELIPGLAHQQGRAVLLSSHRMEEIQQICDRLIIINRGEIIITGTDADLRIIEITSGDPDRAEDILNDMGEVVNLQRRNDGTLEVIAPNLEVEKLTEELSSGQVPVEKAGEKEFNLEEIFLRLTSEEEE